jgi:hypothetical protein
MVSDDGGCEGGNNCATGYVGTNHESTAIHPIRYRSGKK